MCSGFLRSRRDKRKEKKTKKKKDSSNETIGKEDKSEKLIYIIFNNGRILLNIFGFYFSEEKEENESKNNTPEIDDEGYRIQPTGQWSVDKGNFDSSSDSGY